MKRVILLILGISFCACNDGNVQPEPFNFEKAAGLWVLDEILFNDGTIESEPSSIGIFGAYSESFKLNADKTFVPFRWISKNEIRFSSAEDGICRYENDSEKLFFDGAFKLEFDIIKFDHDELWLKNSNGINKFRRQ